MPDDQLNVRIVVDASQLEGGMREAASTVGAASEQMRDKFSQLASAAIVSKTANLELQNSLTTLARSGLAPTHDQVEEVAKSMFDAAVATDALKSAQQEAYPALDRTAASANNARSAMMGLTNEMGLRGNRALSTFISQSQTLGPILNAAFTGIAVVGFIQLAVQAGQKLTELIEKTWIFTDAQKEMYQGQIEANKQIAQLNDQHAKALRDIQVVGLSLAQAEQLRAKWAKEDADGLKGTVKGKQDQLAIETRLLATLRERQATETEMAGDPGTGQAVAVPVDLSKDIEKQEQAVERLNKELGVLRAQLLLADDAAKGAGLKAGIEGAKEDQKAMLKQREEADMLNAALQRIKNELFRLAEAQKTLAREETQFGDSAATKQAQDELRALIEKNAAERKFRDDRERDAEQESVKEIGIRERQVQEELRLGQITAIQARDQLNQLAKQKLQIEEKYLDDRIAEITARLLTDDEKTYAQDLAEWSKLLTDKKKAEQNYIAERQKNNEGAATREAKVWQQLGQEIGRSFDGAIRGLISGTETFRTAFIRMGEQILEDFLGILVKMVEQWIVQHIFMEIFGKATNMSGIASAAALAGANAYASTAAIPLIGPALAPAAAATAYAGALSFEGLASAAGGMLQVPDNMLAMVHKDESILPSWAATPLREGLRAGGLGSKGLTVHFSPVINAIDSKGMGDALNKHSDELMKVIAKKLRRSNF
jgi:hypothetical protein